MRPDLKADVDSASREELEAAAEIYLSAYDLKGLEATFDGLARDIRWQHLSNKLRAAGKAVTTDPDDAEEWSFSGTECPLCGGPGTNAGKMCRRMWIRCPSCGLDYSREV